MQNNQIDEKIKKNFIKPTSKQAQHLLKTTTAKIINPNTISTFKKKLITKN
jgi:hypothetical protein